MTIAESLLPELDAEMENTRKVLAAVPEGQWGWKPHAKSMSLGMLAHHLSEMPGWGVTTLKGDELVMEPGEYKPTLPSSSEELLANFEKGRKDYRDAIADLDDATMGRMWSLVWGGQKVMEMPKIAVIRGMVMNHMIHHRGQLTVYIRLLDGKVPGVYGPSADEM